MNELRTYQSIGAGFLAAGEARYLADDPGLGKCRQVIEACDRLDLTRIVILCPASVVLVWEAEFAKWQRRHRSITVVEDQGSLISTDFDAVVIASYNKAELVRLWLNIGRVHALVLDEAQALKNAETQRVKAVLRHQAGALVKRSDRVWLLSGTPAPLGPHEMWAPLRFIWPAVIAGANGAPMDYDKFMARYCRVKQTQFGPRVIGGQHLEELRARLSPILLRRRVDDVLPELPPIGWYDVPVAADIAELENDIPAHVRDQMREALRLDNWTLLDDLAPHFASYRRMVGLAKVPAIGGLLRDELESGAVERVLVFAWHTSVIEALHRELESFGVVEIRGATSMDNRRKSLASFAAKSGARVALVQILAGGTGLTMVSTNEVFFAECSWNPADNAQAAKRAHRLGQTRPVRVRVAYAPKSLDGPLMRTFRRRSQIAVELLDPGHAKSLEELLS